MTYFVPNRDASKSLLTEPFHQLPESVFIDQISQAIKLFRRREELCVKVARLDQQHAITQIGPIQADLMAINSQLMRSNATIKQFQGRECTSTRTYLYTIFMRLSENLQFSLERAQNTQRRDWEQKLLDARLAMTEQYDDMCYSEATNVIDFLSQALRRQHERILLLVPALRPPRIQAETSAIRRNESLPQQILSRHLLSLDVKPPLATMESKNRLSAIAFKELETEKRAKERKKEIKTWNKLYSIMAVKAPKIDNSPAFQTDLYKFALARNEAILSNVKALQKEFEKTKQFRSKLITFSKKKIPQEASSNLINTPSTRTSD